METPTLYQLTWTGESPLCCPPPSLPLPSATAKLFLQLPSRSLSFSLFHDVDGGGSCSDRFNGACDDGGGADGNKRGKRKGQKQ